MAELVRLDVLRWFDRQDALWILHTDLIGVNLS